MRRGGSRAAANMMRAIIARESLDQSAHDLAAGTAVFRKSAIGGGRGFLPVLPAHEGEADVSSPEPANQTPAGTAM